ncbi:L,D-transpeptidase [Acrocarpospora catenulata]|uniref:L,D-transpeptidase n=1 Tax=Acrocarpospora catenulata TaxID=2836182 RepID=UPI001BD9DB23|nr:L,D-transpeptidase [Acrocarpospora catenulata]
MPVVETQPGWTRVLLPSRPNHSTGWLYTAAGGVKVEHNPFHVIVSRSRHALSVFKGHHRIGTWAVAVGAPRTPTPTGRTFIMGNMTPPNAAYGPRMMPLGTHSEVLKTFDGGPGTIAFHGWNDASVFGKSVSNGCVRVPAAAQRVLMRLPLGTNVLITR